MGIDIAAQYSCGHAGIVNVHPGVVQTLAGKPMMIGGRCAGCEAKARAYEKAREERDRRNKEAEECEEYEGYEQG
ncbi:hypothetical protein ACJ73_01352 [Blastomyces percursus]|uniref:Uncharacterized protein n=1 Tax=Blastomyces percursus TaxID=1658174 RepID=A0A1J9RGY5_9EURO|nr:hypothetical protein ACJ73_01352 [Blastomyces percursus]